jgi:hypothetical protein
MHQPQLTGYQSTHRTAVVHSDQDLVRLGVIRLDWVTLRMNNLGSVSRLEPVRPVVTGTGAHLYS